MFTSLQADHDDDNGGHAGGSASGNRNGRRQRASTAARYRDCRRPDPEPNTYAVYDPGYLFVCRQSPVLAPAPQGSSQAGIVRHSWSALDDGSKRFLTANLMAGRMLRPYVQLQVLVSLRMQAFRQQVTTWLLCYLMDIGRAAWTAIQRLPEAARRKVQRAGGPEGCRWQECCSSRTTTKLRRRSWPNLSIADSRWIGQRPALKGSTRPVPARPMR